MKRTATLAVALVLASGCSSGSGKGKDTGPVTTEGAAGAQTVTVEMTDRLTFSPNVVDARVGTVTLTTTNKGTTPHNLTFGDTSLGKTGTISGGESKNLRLVLGRAGIYRFTCTFHQGMTGKVVVS